MEILDKGKIKINDVYANLKERLIAFFRKKSTDSIGIYISEDYIYLVSIFYDEGNWHLFYFDKEELPAYGYEEKSAIWVKGIIEKHNLNNATVTLGTPDKFLLLRDIELKNISNENIKETIYWDFALNYFNDEQKFNIVYYPLDNELYFAAALEEKNQKYIHDFFEKEEILISDWTTLPPQIKLNMNGSYISIFEKHIIIPADVDMLKLNEYTPAIYAAMVGADLFEGKDNITFPSPYKAEYTNWKLISATIFIAWILAFIIVFAYDNYKLYSLRNELQLTNAKCQALSVNKTQMEIYKYILNDTKTREIFIADKMKDRLPLTGIILHLGTLITDGVVLTSGKFDNDNIIVEGEAMTKEDVERFFDEINERKDIFIKSPKSLTIENRNGIKFSFSIKL